MQALSNVREKFLLGLPFLDYSHFNQIKRITINAPIFIFYKLLLLYGNCFVVKSISFVQKNKIFLQVFSSLVDQIPILVST